MAERVVRHKDRTPFEAHGVDAEIRSTLHKRVDLPSGGYLIFDYAEAFTVIDVNTGRFVGSRSRTSTARLEETVTKNNVEAAKEVVRQLRLRDIGGIIVIDFVDMANPKNRATVEEALARARTRPDEDVRRRDLPARPGGDDASERHRGAARSSRVAVRPARATARSSPRRPLSWTSSAGCARSPARALARRRSASSSTPAYDMLVGPARGSAGRDRGGHEAPLLPRIEPRCAVRPRNVLDKAHWPSSSRAAVEEGQELELKLVEVGLYDPEAGVGKLDGLDVAVAGAAKLVGKKVRVRVERVLNGTAFARLAGTPEHVVAAITAEGLAEKPTRASRPRKAVEPVAEAVEPEPGDDEPRKRWPRKPTQRLQRRRRSARDEALRPQPPQEAGGRAAEEGAVTVEEPEPVTPKIHLPAADLGTEPNADGANGDEATAEAATPKKKTRRGSRGGRRRRKPAAAAAASPEAEPAP